MTRSPRRLDPVRVLIVDDHDLVAQSFARLLRDESDITVVGIGSSVAEGISKAHALGPDVILFDYTLPDGDGVTAAKRLMGEGSPAKVIILTGSGNAAARMEASAAGCAGYIEKTLASGDLADVVRRVHRGHLAFPTDDSARLPSLDQLAIHYQPIVDLHTEELMGFEALVRWLHPRRGLLLPSEFIGLAEETGFVSEIDAWVLVHALDQVARWRTHFPGRLPLTMSVNLSAGELSLPEHVRGIVADLEMSGVKAGVVLEITETALLNSADEVVQALHELRRHGVAIALDDFGTGYSSLDYLRRLPIDVLKIDKCFTGDLPHRERTLKLAEAIVALCSELGIAVVAEGIETIAQVECLRSLGPMHGQGYYFSRPLSAADAAKALTQSESEDAGR